MRSTRLPTGAGRRRLLPALALLLVAWGAPGARAADEPATTRWYERLRDGKKISWSSVTWSVSTWQGKPTVHDRTEIVTRTTRDMAGHFDVFQDRTLIDLERGDDGTLWWLKIETVEAARRSVSEITWTGTGYESVSSVEDQTKKVTVPLEVPVMADAEAFLSRRARDGTLTAGEKLELRELDVEGRRADVKEIEVLGPEEVEAENGPVATVKVVIRHPKTGTEEWMWMDREGAYVRSLGDSGVEQRRVTREKSQTMPRRPPSFSITAPSRPLLERVMSADRLWVNVLLAADAGRKLPEFPVSPWSRAEPAQKADGGWRIPALLTAYDKPDATTTLPVDPKGFERELESTPLMPCGHPDLKRTALGAIGRTTDARKAAERLARWVHDELTKGSPDVAEASALQILADRKGDCSEHALLYVALCRAVGIPARRCTGWVNIGSDWGAHAWAEIWLGEWVGADPTTGEVGTGARYLFFGYQDDPDSFPGVVSSRIAGRIALEATRIEEDGVAFDLVPGGSNVKEGGEGDARWWIHVPTGVEVRGLPEGWTVKLGRERVQVRGPGVSVTVTAQADQGRRLDELDATRTTFAGRPAYAVGREAAQMWVVHTRRRIVMVQGRVPDEAATRLLEYVLAPTFAEQVTDPATTPPAPRPTPPPEATPKPAPAPAPGLAPARGAWTGTWTLDVAGSVALQSRRMIEHGTPGDEAGRAAERLGRLLRRVPVTLKLDGDGVAELTFAREGAEAPVPARRGTWTAAGEGITLKVADEVEGATEGRAVLRQGGERIEFTWGAWSLLLQR
jgi:hypothetical protein